MVWLWLYCLLLHQLFQASGMKQGYHINTTIFHCAHCDLLLSLKGTVSIPPPSLSCLLHYWYSLLPHSIALVYFDLIISAPQAMCLVEIFSGQGGYHIHNSLCWNHRWPLCEGGPSTKDSKLPWPRPTAESEKESWPAERTSRTDDIVID